MPHQTLQKVKEHAVNDKFLTKIVDMAIEQRLILEAQVELSWVPWGVGYDRVFIEKPDGKSFALSSGMKSPADLPLSVYDIKKRIFVVEGIMVQKQCLTFNSKEMKDLMMLADYGIFHDATILLTIRK